METNVTSIPLVSNIPSIGRIVHYQTDGRGGYRYSLPAIVVRTLGSTDPRAVADGKVQELPDPFTVDLFVFSVDGECYGENAVPYSDVVSNDGVAERRTWRWPDRK